MKTMKPSYPLGVQPKQGMNKETEKLKAEQRQQNYGRFFNAVVEWQRKNGNNCTICWNHNHNFKCEVCGWWGKVPPDGMVTTPAPMITDFLPV